MAIYRAISLIILLARGLAAQPIDQHLSTPIITTPNTPHSLLNDVPSDQGLQKRVAKEPTTTVEFVGEKVIDANGHNNQQPQSSSCNIYDPLTPMLNKLPTEPGSQKEVEEKIAIVATGRSHDSTVQHLSSPSFSISDPTIKPELKESQSDLGAHRISAEEQTLNIELAAVQTLTKEAEEQKGLNTEAATEQIYTSAAEAQTNDLGIAEEQALIAEPSEKVVFLKEAAEEQSSLNVIRETSTGNSSVILIDQNAKRELTQTTPLDDFTLEPTMPAIIVQMIPEQQFPIEEIHQQTARAGSEVLKGDTINGIKQGKSTDKSDTVFNNGLTNEYLKYLHSKGILDENGNEVMKDEELKDDPQVENFFGEELNNWDLINSDKRERPEKEIIISENISASDASLAEIQREQVSHRKESSESWDSWVEQQLEAYLNHLKGVQCKCETAKTEAPTKKVEADKSWTYEEPIFENELPPPAAVSYATRQKPVKIKNLETGKSWSNEEPIFETELPPPAAVSYATRQKPKEKSSKQGKSSIEEDKIDNKARKQTIRIAHQEFEEFLGSKLSGKNKRNKKNKDKSKNTHKTRTANNGKNHETKKSEKSQAKEVPQIRNSGTKKMFDERLQDRIQVDSQHSGRNDNKVTVSDMQDTSKSLNHLKSSNMKQLETLERTKQVLLRLKETLEKFKARTPPEESKEEESLEKIKNNAPESRELLLRSEEILSPVPRYQKRMQVKSLDEKMTSSLKKYLVETRNSERKNRERKKSNKKE